MSIKIYKDGKWQILPGQGSPGKSAYDYASENGFVGSEEDFANALGSIDDIANKIENIDTIPTEGSNNLVTSGGVKKALVDLSISENVVLSNQLNEVEANITALYGRTDDNYDNINKILDILKGEEKWPDDWVPGDSACCETLREEVSELEDRVSVIESTGGSDTVDVEKLKETFDNRYLVKVEDREQSVDNNVDFNKDVDINGNLTTDTIKSTDFVSGMAIGGAGFSLYNDETENGKSSVLEVDKLYVRKEAHFAELVIDQIRFSLGETVFSNGGATISEVDDTNPDYYKCYYEKTRQENGKEITGIESGFIVGDLARCQRFDAENNLLKYYWCKVVEVGDDYFCLSKTDKDDTGLDVNISKPEAGDDVVQLGNVTKTDRQSAVIISPFNGGSVAIFSGINSYSLSDRNYIGLGTYYEDGKYKSKIYGYGDMYFGVRPGQEGHYIKFDGEKLTINGDVIIGEDDIKDVTINNKTLVNWLKDLAEKTDQYDIDFWSGPDLVVDGRLEMSDVWIADGLAENHLGDRYTCTTDGTMWQFTKNGDGEDAVYTWVEQDSLSNDEVNNLIQSALDGHRRVFTEQPKGPYDIGDLWIYTSGDSTELYICVKDNNLENSYSESDWKNVTETAYAKIKDLEESIKNLSVGTDDSVNFYFDEKEDILTESNSWSEDEKSSHTGDLSYAIDEDKSYKWDGASWVDITGSTYHNILKSLHTTSSAVDGKIEITFCPKEEPFDPSHGDLYYNCNKELLSWDSDNGKWISLNDLSELEYLTSLFKNNVITDGVVIGDMLAVVDSDNNVVAGIYGGGNDNLNDNFEHEWYGTRMIFAGANNIDSNATFATSVFEDGTIITEGEQGTITIRENDIFIDSKSSKGGIYLGFDDNGAPILSYKDSEDNNIWNLKEGGIGFVPKDEPQWPDSGDFTYDATNNVWTLGGDLLVTGGVSFYSTLGDYKIGNIMDGINVDNTSIGINESNQLYVKNSGSNGVDEEAVNRLISEYTYSKSSLFTKEEVLAEITKVNTGGSIDLDPFVSEEEFTDLFKTNFDTSIAGYAKQDDLEGFIKTVDWSIITNKPNDLLIKSDADGYYASKTAFETANNNLTTLTSIFNDFKTTVKNDYVETADLQTLTFNAGSFTTQSYNTKSDVTVKIPTSIEHLSDSWDGNLNINGGLLVNGGALTYNKTNKVWQLDGDLLVTGGVSFYSALDNSYFDYTEGINTDNIYIINSGGKISLNYDRLVSDLGGEGLGSGSSIDSYTKDETDDAIKLAKEQILGIVEDSSLTGAYDTLKEVANWIVSDGSAASGVVNRVAALETKVNSFKNTTYTFSGGTNGFSVTPSDGITQTISISHNTATTSNPGLMTAAMVTKLDGIATGAEVNVQSDWNTTNTASDSFIKNKPSLAAVATSGSYNDLSNKPTITTYSAGTGISISSGAISIQAASSTLGGVKTTSTVTSSSGLTACPIINGVVYYKDTNTTYTIDNTVTGAIMNTSNKLYLIGVQSRNTSIKSESSSIYMQGGKLTAETFAGDLDGNAVTATKLKTSVKLWGNSFDGNSDINSKITFSLKSTDTGVVGKGHLVWGDYASHIGATYGGTLCMYASNNIRMTGGVSNSVTESNQGVWITNNGTVGINCGENVSNDSSYSMYVGSLTGASGVYIKGDLTVTGGITFYSQKSLKNIHETDFLSLDQLSNIHAIKYTWKDGRDDRMHVGGIADDIQKIIPEVIYENDGYLTMDYGNAGFVIGTSLIKPVVDHEKRIKELEEEVARLNNLLNA